MFKCAFYEKEITPPLGFNMPGYFNVRAAGDVKDRLYAKALVVSNDSKKIAIISIDCLYAETYMRDDIVDRICKFTDIKSENILYSANHSHTAIPLKSWYDEPYVDTYAKIACDLIADCVILADKRLEECSIRYGVGEVNGIAFVRDFYMKNSTPTTNPGRLNPDIEKSVADIDRDLPVVIFEDSNGKALGSIISYACHQDCVGGEDYSGDFSSSITYELKKKYGENFVSMFMAGASGNINHFDVTKSDDSPDHYIKMGKIIADETLKVIEKAQPVCGSELLSEYEVLNIPRLDVADDLIENAKHTIATVKPIEGVKIAADSTDSSQYNLAMAKILMKFVNGPEKIAVPLQTIRVGNLVFYAFPGEIYSQFGQMIKEKSTAKKCVVVTHCNASIGYVPTSDMFYDTIYESLPGSCTVEKEGGYKMVDKLLQMGDDLLKS